MPLDRRSFLRTVGAGSAAAVLPLVQARGREAGWFPTSAPVRRSALPLADSIRLDSNENPLGPAPEALKAMSDWFREAGRYPDMIYDPLVEGIARYVRAPKDHLIFGTGSGEILKVAVEAFVRKDRPLVVGAPTFETCAKRATDLGLPVRAVPVDQALRLDLAAMADACQGAGLVFLCNPNNPTGTVHGAAAMSQALARMLKGTPDLIILVDEAYHEYVDDPDYSSMIPFALADKRVVVSRTFSKAFGMAGLRLGFAVGRPETLARVKPHLVDNNVNQLVAAAAVTSLGLTGQVERERRRNTEARQFTTEFFRAAGYTVAESRANFVMVDIRRDSKTFKEACAAKGVRVGRPFPPLTTHARISIGTIDEMRKAVQVFQQVLV